jgi:hypothetical protein
MITKSALFFGIKPNLTVRLPQGVEWCSLRLSNNDFARAIFTINGRTEEWFLGEEDGALVPYLLRIAVTKSPA